MLQGQSESPMADTASKVLLVLGSGVGMYFSIGIVLIHGFSVFIVPITQDTGWDRAHVAAVVAPVALVNGLMQPLIGALTDKVGPRLVLIVSSLTMGAGLIGIGLTSEYLYSFVAAVVIASILGGAQTGVPYTHVIVGWFHARRGLALGIMLSFVGLAIASVPVILSWVISMWGWRSAYVVAGVASMVVLLPIALFIIRDPPARREVRQLDGHSLGEALKTASFWLMLGAFMLNYLAAAAGSISLPVILVDRGLSTADAAVVMTAVGVAFIITRLGFGALLDRFPAAPLTSLVFLAPAVGHLLLAGSSSPAPAYVSAILFGLASGAEGDAMGYLLARRFGMRSFGKIFGINYFAFTLGAGVGPATLNLLAAGSAGYEGAFVIFAIVGTLAPALLITEWRRSRRPLPQT
jgi:MFS family permease